MSSRSGSEQDPALRHWLLPAQAWWDTQRFDQPVWHVAAWRDQKVRHIQLHVAKALGKVVAALGEGTPAASGAAPTVRVRDEVLPDVAIYRSQLLNTFPACGAPPAAPSQLSARAGDYHAEPLLHVAVLLSRASAQLATYIEPREHGVASPPSLIRGAIQDLHASAEAL